MNSYGRKSEPLLPDDPLAPIPVGGVLLGRVRAKLGGHGVDSAWQRHVGFAPEQNSRRVLDRIQGAIPTGIGPY